MIMEEMDKQEKTTQKILFKAISEERVAVDFYLGAVASVKPEEREIILDRFVEIGKEEKMDHLKKLVNFAELNGYKIPFKYKDYEKYAEPKMFKLLDSLKEGQNAVYYIEKAIESEIEAIKSYEEVLDWDYVFEFQPILLDCYYDEIQHLDELKLLL